MLAGFIASRKHFRYFLSLGDFALPQSRPTTSHVMTAVGRPKTLILAVSQSKGLGRDQTDY